MDEKMMMQIEKIMGSINKLFQRGDVIRLAIICDPAQARVQIVTKDDYTQEVVFDADAGVQS